MSTQSTWLAPPPKGFEPAKLKAALLRASVLADWYSAYKPAVRRIVVTKADYHAFETQIGTCGISLTNDGIRWRGFLIEPQL
jgi:hypothetical protein